MLRLILKIINKTFILIPVYNFNQSLTNGTTTLINLQNLKGKCAFMLACIRNTGASNTSNGYMKLLDVGQNNGASIRHCGSMSNQSLLGRGVGLPAAFIKDIVSVYHLDNDVLTHKNYYVIPFCDSILQAFMGVQSGGSFTFQGDNTAMSITMGSTPVQEIHTFNTVNSSNATGYYRFSYKNELSIPCVYNCSTAAMADAVNNISYLKSRNVTCSFNTTLSAPISNAITVTFTTPECQLDDVLQIINLGVTNSSGVVDNVYTTLTQKGTNGIASMELLI